MKHRRRPALAGELAVVALLLVVYDRVSDLAAVRAGSAVAHGRALLQAEGFFGLQVERTANHALAGVSWLQAPASLYYDLAHISVTMAVLLGLYVFRPEAYRPLRRALLAVNLVGLTSFVLFPVAPPRLLPGAGFVDVVARSGTWGAWEAASSPVASHANQYASMPSLHVAWALWAAVGLAALGGRWRRLGPLHVAVTVGVVLFTGNHYLLDVVGAAVVLLLCVRATEGRPAGLPAGAPPSVLIVSASMGAGHDGVAYELERRLQAQGVRTEVVDYLEAMPLGTGRFIRAFYAGQLRYAPRSYEWLYAKLDTNRAAERIASHIAGWGKPSLLRAMRRGGHTLALSTYPLAGQALGQLRRQGRLAVPAITFLTDLDVHKTWLDDDTDLYLAVYEGSAREATRRTSCPSIGVGPVLPSAFRSPVTPAERATARAALGLPDGGPPVVLIVTGSWGVGNVASTVAAIGDSGAGYPVVLCGRNEDLRSALERQGSCLPLGWTTDVRRVLAAADVVVHNAGGLSSLEAFAIGIPVIGHACLPGHGHRNAQAMADAGVAGLAEDDAELVALLRRLAGTPEGQQMARRASALFRTDPTGLLLELARGAAVSSLAPAGPDRRVPHHPATPSRRHRAARPPGRPARRRAPVWALRAAAVLTVIPVGAQALTYGVALATEHGLGVARPPRAAQAAVYAGALLDASEVVDPQTPRLLRAAGLSAIVPGALARAHPAEVRRLARDGIAVLAADDRPHTHDPRKARLALQATLASVRYATGEAHPPVVVSRPLGPVDLGLAWDADALLGRPDVVVTPRSPLRLDDRDQVLVDLRGLNPTGRTTVVQGFTREARGLGLRVHPWGTLWRQLA